MRKFKKLISCAAAATLAATSLLSGASLGASADTTLITNGGPYTTDAEYIATYFRESYYQDTAFEIQFKYDTVGTPTDEELGYNDTFEFLTFDTAWGGWEKTTVGPAGYDVTANPNVKPEEGKVYTVEVPIKTIESKLKTGGTPYGINLQTGGIGTSIVSIVSLKLVTGSTPYVQEPFTATGKWTKGTASTFTVDPAGAATVNASEWNIEVSAINLSAWTNPTVDVTVTYAEPQTYVQAEIMVPTGAVDENGNPVYEAIDPNYVSPAAGTYTYTTEIPNTTKSFIAAYDACTVTEIHVYDNKETVSNPVSGETASTIANKMGVAWDLGNALESVDESGNVGEKAWGNPKTTKKLVQAVKAAGFNTIRIPISYLNMIENDNTVNDAYMARIEQVVNYAYELGMYVVINIHNDGAPTVPGSWINISATGSEFEAIKNKFAAVWTDIATNLVGYDQKLIFEGANELMIEGNYTPSDAQLAAVYPNINALNQAFVNAVRGTGTNDNNDDRVLIVCGYNTNIDYTTTAKGFVKPTDTSANRLMLSVHYYAPDDFTLGSGTQWPTGSADSSNYNSKEYMEAQIISVSRTGEALGMPIFLGEYGPENHSNNTTARATYCYWLNFYARLSGNVVTAYWDNGVEGIEGTALFNRTNNVITTVGKTIVDSILAGYNLSTNPNQILV